jgi:hypothetical protein
MKNMKLSELNIKDDFAFAKNQTAKYILKLNSGRRFQEIKPDEHTIYEVLKKHKKSVECRIVRSSIEFIFAFDGVDSCSEKGVNCNVIKI